MQCEANCEYGLATNSHAKIQEVLDLISILSSLVLQLDCLSPALALKINLSKRTSKDQIPPLKMSQTDTFNGGVYFSIVAFCGFMFDDFSDN